MAQDLIQESGVFPVNSNGEIVLQSGTGTTDVVGYINSSQVPTDVNTNKMVVKLPAETALFTNDSSNHPIGLSNAGRVTVPDSSLGNVKLRNSTLVMSRIGLLGTQSLASGTFVSYLEEFALPADVVNIQVGVMNAHPTSSPQIRVRVGFTEVAGDPTLPLNTLVKGGQPLTSEAAWAAMTRNGASAISLLAMPGSNVNNPYVTWFDPYPVASLTRTDAGRKNPVIKIITEFGAYQSGVASASTITNQIAGTNITGWEQDTDLAQPPYGFFWRSRSQNVAAGVDPTALTSTVEDNSSLNYHAPILLRFTLKSGKGIQVVIIGDSTLECAGDSNDKYGWIYRSIHQLSRPELPIAVCNFAQSGTDPSKWSTMASSLLQEVPNSLLVLPNMSPNTGSPLGDTVISASIVNQGTGGTPGPVVLTGTTGTGTLFQINATVGPLGGVVSLGSIVVGGPYSILPTNVANEPVTGSGGVVGCTLNLSFTGSNLTIAIQQIAKIKSIAEQYGCGTISVTCLHSNTAGKDWKGSDPLLSRVNTDTLNSNEVVMDYSSALAGDVVGGQVQFKAGTTTDGLHPNAVGHALAANTVGIPFFKKLTG